MKINTTNIARLVISISGAGIMCLYVLSRNNIIENYKFLSSTYIFVLGMGLFLIGLYSKKHGLKCIMESSGGDAAEGYESKKHDDVSSYIGTGGSGGD